MTGSPRQTALFGVGSRGSFGEIPTSHLEILVEEPSAEVIVSALLRRHFGEDGPPTWKVRTFQGKLDLLKNLPARLRAYPSYLPPQSRILILLDRDQTDCRELKARLEAVAFDAGHTTGSATHSPEWTVLNRIVIEELEAWYWGDPMAIAAAWPGFDPHLANKAAYRDADAIKGGTWERLEKELQKAGYFRTGLRKIEAARTIAPHLQPERNASASFKMFWRAIQAMKPVEEVFP